MTHRSKLFGLAAMVGLLAWASPASADPCGLVPPIIIGDGKSPIERVGAQKTYVFYKNGVESIALRPGFSGKVSEFGMLIPFPSVPSIRKVPDSIFGHVACAVDPREEILDLRVRWKMMRARSMSAVLESSGPDVGERPLNVNTVNVLKEEAVGMYEVVVLEAGSADALKKWLDEHKYKFPTGMEPVAQEYVQARWVFVAVRTAVGKASGVEPEPGMREVNPAMAEGETFDGNVQAMGFRFKTDRLVVPMRLSAYNEGRLRNIVYLLTDSPKKINNIDPAYVKRQVTGADLLRNVTGRLPVRVLRDGVAGPGPIRPLPVRPGGGRIMPPPGGGGGLSDEEIAAQFQALYPKRDPRDCNGYARDLFAGDLLAARTGRLEHPYEDYEKALLAIAERLDLRGDELDESHRQALDDEIEAQVGEAINGLRGMTLTVVDGDFPREVLARENLTFSNYRMPADKNNLENYDAKLAKKPEPTPTGEVVWGLTYPLEKQEPGQQEEEPAQQEEEAAQQEEESAVPDRPLGYDQPDRRSIRPVRPGGIAGHIHDFTDRKKAPDAADALIAMKGRALPHVIREANSGTDLRRRGWSVVVATDVGSAVSRQALKNLSDYESQPYMVRLWAAAGLVKMSGPWQLSSLAKELVPDFPALGRPIVKKLVETAQGPQRGETMIQLTIDLPVLKSELDEHILALGAGPLVRTMQTGSNDDVRNKAAGYIGALAAQGDSGVQEAVASAYPFTDKNARRTPWEGGALWLPFGQGFRFGGFLPGGGGGAAPQQVSWEKEPATQLVDSLIRWMLWADLQQKPDVHMQIHNNIRSVGFANAIGYQREFNDIGIKGWLRKWKKIVGKDKLRSILEQQDAVTRHQDVLDEVEPAITPR